MRLIRRPAWTRPVPYAGDIEPWDVDRLRRVLAAMAVLGLGVAGWGVYSVLSPGTTEMTAQAAATPRVAPTLTTAERREAIAAAAMLHVPPLSVQDPAPDTTQPAPITIPAPTGVGAARIPDGYPRTPEGAVGQLASVLAAVVQQMSLSYTQEVYSAWSAPNADVAAWPMTVNVRSFLGKTRMGAAKSVDATIVAFPVAGQVKGSDGPNWQLACVLLDIRATNRDGDQSKVLYGHCDPMQWDQGRWVIAAGAAAAPAPATWPGTALSAQAGWRPWRMDSDHQD